MSKTASTLFAAALLAAATAAAQPSGPQGNLPLPPAQMLQRLQRDEFQIVSAKGAGGGVRGAEKVELAYADGEHIAAKWKAAPASGDGWNNSPRREIASYALQQLFLDPDDYVVPPVTARCIALDTYAPIRRDASPTLEGSRCVYGVLAAWLTNVAQPDKAFDRERFSKDPEYAERFADLNLFAYLAAHRDARDNNFLESKDPANPQLFSVDNGIAFGGVLYNFFTWHFDELHTSVLPKHAVERLRGIRASDLARLGVLQELRADANGVLQTVEPGPNLDPEQGTRLSPGHIQFGLTRAEIDAIAERLRVLLEKIDGGAVGVL